MFCGGVVGTTQRLLLITLAIKALADRLPDVPRYIRGWFAVSPLRPGGFEPPTDGLEIRCSIQLSYGRL